MYKRTTINESVQPRFLDIEEFMTYTRINDDIRQNYGKYADGRKRNYYG